MSNYSEGKIYKILNSETDDVYVGSTTQPLSKIMYDHKCACKRHNFKVYKKFEQIGVDNFLLN